MSSRTRQILQEHLISGEPEVGEVVRLRPDLVVLNDGSGPMVFRQLAAMGVPGPAAPRKVALVCDHLTPAPHLQAAGNLNAMRDFATRHRIDLFYDVGRGIEHALVLEQQLAPAGALVFGADSHTSTLGASGILGFGFGATDMAALLAVDETWLIVPEVAIWYLTGGLRPGVTGKDVGLWLLRELGLSGAAGTVLEFHGPGVTALGDDDRAAFCNMLAETGSDSTLMVQGTDAEPEQYGGAVRLDLAAVEPLIALPGSPGLGQPFDDLVGTPVSQVYIGNCANGSLTDLRLAARVLSGHKVAAATRCTIVPATQGIAAQAAREGLLEIFAEAGVTVLPPGCAACYGGHSGVVDARDVVVANINRNFPGRMGHRDARIYLANTIACAAAAVTGEISRPADFVTGAGGHDHD